MKAHHLSRHNWQILMSSKTSQTHSDFSTLISAKHALGTLSNQQAQSGTSLMTQGLRFPAPNAVGLGLIPGQGTRSYMLN